MIKSTFIWIGLFLFFQNSLSGQEIKPMPYKFSSQVEKAFKYTSQQATAYSIIGRYQKALQTDRLDNYGKTKWLGGILQELSGINPLTINQDVLTERLIPPNSSYYSLIESTEPAVLINDQGVPFNGPRGYDKYDILLYHPPAKYLDGRPDWLYRNGKYKSYEVDSKVFQDFEGPYLVKAYKQSEGILATPLDIIEINDLKQDTRTLVLPPGMYLFEIRNQQGEQKFFTDTIEP